MRLLMIPADALKYAIFKASGNEYELEQRCSMARAWLEKGFAEPCDREYRILTAAENRNEAAAIDTLQILLRSPEQWQCLLGHYTAANTIKSRSWAFRLISRLGCAIEQLMAAKHRTYPFTVFKLLRKDMAIAEAIAEARQCDGKLLDEFTVSLKRRFTDASSLLSAECLSILQAVALKINTSICQVESLHATTRRLLKTHSTQTHVRDILDLKASWTIGACRRNSDWIATASARQPLSQRHTGYTPSKPAQGRMLPRSRSAANFAKKSSVSRRGGKVKRKCNITAFNVFLRQISLGQRGRRPSLKAAHDQYKALDEDTLGVLRSKAARARQAKKLGSKRPLGQTTRETNRAILRDAVKAWTSDGKTLSDNALQSQLDMYSYRVNVSKSKMSLGHVRQMQRSNEKKEKAHSDYTALSEYARTYGKRTIDALAAALPGIPKDSLLPLPTGIGSGVEFAADLDQQRKRQRCSAVAAMAAYNVSHDPRTPHTAIDSSWQAFSETLREHDCPGHAGSYTEPPKQPCQDASMCVCSGAGYDLFLLRNSFFKHLKAVLKGNKLHQALLVEGKLVVRFSTDMDDTDIWMHIGMHYLRPFRPTWQMVYPVAAPPAEPESVPGLRLYIQACVSSYVM